MSNKAGHGVVVVRVPDGMIGGRRIFTGATIEEMLDEWEPPEAPVNCADCFHAKVDGSPERPTARCIKGHHERIPLSRMIRAHNPRGFRNIQKCEDFEIAS